MSIYVLTMVWLLYINPSEAVGEEGIILVVSCGEDMCEPEASEEDITSSVILSH